MTNHNNHADIVFVGGGHMSEALIAGLRQQAPNMQIVVVDRNASKRQHLQDQYHVTSVADIADLPPATILLLAVRPSDMQAACASLPHTEYDAVITIALGITIQTISNWLPAAPKNIVRAMPNTPSAVGCGMTACFGAPSSAIKKQIAFIFESSGEVVWLPKEELLDLATAVSGSGPAYFYFIAEAMLDAAIEMGLSSDTAQILIAQTMQGGALMLMESDKTAKELREAVAVAGGSTERAISVMQKHKLNAIFMEAMQACCKRAQEIRAIHSEDLRLTDYDTANNHGIPWSDKKIAKKERGQRPLPLLQTRAAGGLG